MEDTIRCYKVHNYTPHELRIIRDNDVIVIPSEGMARVAEVESGNSGVLGFSAATAEGGQLFMAAITTVTYGEVTGLPEESVNDVYVVSRPVAEALKGTRADIVVPGALVRDEKGSVIGCKGFVRIS